MSKAPRIIKGYYTRDEAQECVDTWNSLSDVEKSEHILQNTPFYRNYQTNKQSLEQDLSLVKILKSDDWPPRGLNI